jgi:hypothetical protein
VGGQFRSDRTISSINKISTLKDPNFIPHMGVVFVQGQEIYMPFMANS